MIVERSTVATKKEVLSSHFVESSRPSLTTVSLEVLNHVSAVCMNFLSLLDSKVLSFLPHGLANGSL